MPRFELLALAIAGSITLALLYSTAYAGLRALSDGALEAIAESSSPLHNEARRAIRHYAAIRARLRLGRVVFLAIAAGCGVMAVVSHGGAIAFVAAGIVGIVYSILAEVCTAIARRRASKGALRMLRWCRPLEWLMAPWAAPISALAKAVEAIVPAAEPPPEMAVRKVEHVIDQGAKEGSLASAHAELLRNALEFEDTVARQVMVPRIRLVGFEIGTDFADVIAAVQEHAHSRYPVYRETIDQMEGVLYAKDLFGVVQEGRQGVPLQDLIRPVFFAPETQPIASLLRAMQGQRFHLAVVVDEFGGVSGLVTLEDILEELVGEIEDEHDDDLPPIAEQEPGCYIADATISVNDLEDFLGEAISDTDGSYDSLGGMVLMLAGGVPEVGLELRARAFDLKVIEADERAVTRVRLTRRSPERDQEPSVPRARAADGELQGAQ